MCLEIVDTYVHIERAMRLLMLLEVRISRVRGAQKCSPNYSIPVQRTGLIVQKAISILYVSTMSTGYCDQ